MIQRLNIREDFQLATLHCKPDLVIFKDRLDHWGDCPHIDVYDVYRARMTFLTKKIAALGTEVRVMNRMYSLLSVQEIQ